MWIRWWFVDRAVALWEKTVGNFLKDTVMLNVVYMCMGASAPLSARLKVWSFSLPANVNAAAS